jgi:hypothetical protein
MKQTAVQFLIEYMTENFYLTDQSLEQFDIAKEMHKEQIMDAYGQGVADEAGEILDATKDAVDYYRRTYNK